MLLIQYLKKNGKTIVSKIDVSFDGREDVVSFCLDDDDSSKCSILVNSDKINFSTRKIRAHIDQNSLFSPPYFVADIDAKINITNSYSVHQVELFRNELNILFNKGKNKNISDSTVSDEVFRFMSLQDFSKNNTSALIDGCSTKYFNNFYCRLFRNSDVSGADDSIKIKNFHILFRAFVALDVVSGALNNFFSGVNYIGPARAASERYYRKQELEVSEISSDGKNFPMFLASLSTEQQKDFSGWVKSIFGYEVDISQSSGHISINLKTGARSVNITDTGYGVSQILPVLGAIWWAGSIRKNRHSQNSFFSNVDSRTLCIEQPELHLHPAHQSKIADVLVGAVNKSRKLSLIVETHSEALINRIGELIECREIDAQNVQIIIFSSSDDIDAPACIEQAVYDESGMLQNWPYGFFNY